MSSALDITELLECSADAKVKLYPAMIHAIAYAVNQVEEMRVCFDQNAVLGTWNFMTPLYATFHKDDATFSNLWTPYSSDFSTFHQDYLIDTETYGDRKGLFPKPGLPDNCITISCVPWLEFTGFNINVSGDGSYLRPIFTIGKYRTENGRAMLPLAVQAHHAVCDGYHTSKLVNCIIERIHGCRRWMSR